MAAKEVTFFDFKGGINSDDHVLAVEPTYAKDIVNVDLNLDGSASSRKAYDFLGTKSNGYLGQRSALDCTTIGESSQFIYPCSGSSVFTFSTSTGIIISAMITQVGAQIYTNIFDDVEDIGQQDTNAQILTYDNLDNRAYQYKTKFTQDNNRIYIINPFIPLTYLIYNETSFLFELVYQENYIRDFENRSSINDTLVKHNGQRFKCILDHDPSALNEPGVGDDWKWYWELVGPSDTLEAAWALGADTSKVYLKRSETTVVYDEEGRKSNATTVYYDHYDLVAAHTSSLANEPPNNTYWLDAGTSGTLRTGYSLWAVGNTYSGSGATYASNVIKVDWVSNTGFDVGARAGAFASGRLWLANTIGNPNRLYFSRSLTGAEEYYSFFFQFSDPWDKEDNIVVDTDGGYIDITEARAILEVVDYGKGVLVFASNGVWYVSGASGVFRANDYSVEKISDDGLVSSSGVTQVGEHVLYAGLADIYLVKPHEVSDEPTVIPITEKTSQFWKDLDTTSKTALHMAYNKGEKKVYIGMNFEPLTEHNIEASGTTAALNFDGRVPIQPSVFMDMLVYDVKLNAWYTQSINSVKDDDDVVSSATGVVDYYDREWVSFMTDIVPLDIIGAKKLDVLVDDDDVIVTSTASVVSRSTSGGVGISMNIYPTMARYGYYDATPAVEHSDNIWFSFVGQEDYYTDDFKSTFTLDADYPTTGGPSFATDFSENCFIETFPIAFNDLQKFKQVPYMHTLFKQVDTVETNGDLDVVGSCSYQINWNWSRNNSTVKWGTEYQAYKSHMLPVAISNDTSTLEKYPLEYVANKHRIRGRGRSVQFKFKLNPAVGANLVANKYRFHLTGWQAGIDAN